MQWLLEDSRKNYVARILGFGGENLFKICPQLHTIFFSIMLKTTPLFTQEIVNVILSKFHVTKYKNFRLLICENNKNPHRYTGTFSYDGGNNNIIIEFLPFDILLSYYKECKKDESTLTYIVRNE